MADQDLSTPDQAVTNQPVYAQAPPVPWWQTALLAGGSLSEAANARSAGGFIQNPGFSAFSVGARNALLSSQQFDKDNIANQAALTNLNTRQLTNQGIPLINRGLALDNEGKTLTNQGIPYDNQKKALSVQEAALDMASKNLSLTQARAQYGWLAEMNGWPKLGDEDNNKSSPSGTSDNSTKGNLTPDITQLRAQKPIVMSNDDMAPIFAAATANKPAGFHDIFTAIQQKESGVPGGFHVNAVNPTSGAIGTGQVMPQTARNPGYGLTGVDPIIMAQPAANAKFSSDLLYAYGKSVGMTDDDWAGKTPEAQAKIMSAVGRYGGVKAGGDQTGYIKGVLAHAYSNRTAAAAPGGNPGMPVPPSDPAPTTVAANTPPPAQAGGDTAPPSPTPDAPAATATPSPAPAAPTPVQVAGPGAPPESAPASPKKTLPDDVKLLTQGYMNGRIKIDDMTPAQAGMVATTMMRQNIPLLDKLAAPLLEYSLAGPKAGSVKASEEHWVPTTQNGIAGQTNTVTGAFKPMTEGPGRAVTMPDGSVMVMLPGREQPIIIPPNNPGVAGKAFAESQGSKTGTVTAELVPKLVTMGRNAAQSMANIDVGLSALHRAAEGGIPSGYFAPWLANSAAMAKSLGISLPGVDPAAVTTIQQAQKTLAVVAGAILQQTIGKDSQITDAKITHFIHAQPELATDPQAIDKILGWARSQYQYEHTMAMDGMKNVDKTTGMLPPGWEAAYYAKQGSFAPIYDPMTGETKQPEGSPPPDEAPKATQPKVFPMPSPQAVERLKGNPGKAEDFDQLFGPGASQRALGAKK